MKVVVLLGVVGNVALSSGTALAASITYEFTGTVKHSDGSYASIAAGSSVTGSFTINFDAAIPGQVSGAVGSVSNWSLASNGGSGLGEPVPPSLVFSMTASVDGSTFSTGISTYENYVSIGGLDAALSGQQQIFSDADHNLNLSSSIFLQSDTTGFFTPPGNGLPYAYLDNGLPNLAAIDLTKSQGSFDAGRYNGSTFVDQGGLFYALTSLAPTSAVPPGGAPVYPITTPLPGSLGLLFAGLGGLGAFRRIAQRRRKESHRIVCPPEAPAPFNPQYPSGFFARYCW